MHTSAWERLIPVRGYFVGKQRRSIAVSKEATPHVSITAPDFSGPFEAVFNHKYRKDESKEWSSTCLLTHWSIVAGALGHLKRWRNRRVENETVIQEKLIDWCEAGWLRINEQDYVD